MIDISHLKLQRSILSRCMSLCLIGVALLVASPAAAEDPLVGTAQTLDPRGISTAGALIAAPGGVNGVYQNPASIAMTTLYHIEGMYQFTSRENMHMGGLAIVDSQTLPNVAAGVSFNYTGCESNRNSHDSFDGRLSLAGSIGNVFFIGATGRYLRLEQNTGSANWGPTGKSALPASGSLQVKGFTMDAGAGLRLAKIVTLGVVGYNLTHTESAFAPIQLGAGASLSLMDKILIDVDSVIDFTSHTDTGADLRVGGELFLADTVFVRVGYKYDFYYQRNTVAAGLGYLHNMFAIDAGFSQEIMSEGRTVVSIGFKYFVP